MYSFYSSSRIILSILFVLVCLVVDHGVGGVLQQIELQNRHSQVLQQEERSEDLYASMMHLLTAESILYHGLARGSFVHTHVVRHDHS